MSISEILRRLDAEIERLQQARDLLAGRATVIVTAPTGEMEIKSATSTKKRRTLSPEGRQRIAEGQRRRWAAQKVPSVTVLPPVTKRTRRTAANTSSPTQTALTSSVPTGPVAVRAADVKATSSPAPVAAPQSAYSFLMGPEAATS